MFIHLLPTLKLRKPIPIVFRMISFDNYIVKVRDANIYASGDTKQEAIRNLRDTIEAMYALYSSNLKLGPEPVRQFKVLQSYIKEKP